MKQLFKKQLNYVKKIQNTNPLKTLRLTIHQSKILKNQKKLEV